MLGVLVRKDVRRWWADRQAVIVTLVLPLLLTAVLGVSFGGFGGGGPTMDAIPLGIVGDPPTMVRDALEQALEESGFFAPVWCDSAYADAMVRSGDLRAALVFPANLTEDYFSGRRVVIGLWKDPVSVFQADIVEQILRRMLLEVRAGEAAYAGAWSDDWYPEEGQEHPFDVLFSGDSFLDVWRLVRDGAPEAQAAWDQFGVIMDHQVELSDALSEPAVDLTAVERTAGEVGENEVPQSSRNMFDWILPGMGIFFMMFAAANAGGDLHVERESGTLRRLFVAPLRDTDLLLAKWLFAMINGLLQMAVLFAAGRLLFGLNLGPDPLALPLVAVATAGMLASFYLPLALLTRDAKQLGQIGTGVILFLALIGGNFMPAESMPAFLQTLGRFTPNYWANTAFTTVIAYDRGLDAVTTNLLVLGGITVVFLGLSLLIYGRRGGKEGLL